MSGKSALISGGASGAATARKFVSEGAKVAICDIQEDKGHALAKELGANVIFLHLDVTSESSWRDAVAQAEKHFDGLTTLVNSAGISIPATIEQESFEGFRRTIAINLEGTFLGCKYGVAALKDKKGAAIVNVASTLGARAGSIFTSYCASKGGVRLLTRAVAQHCAEQGYDLRVNAILPGAIHTEMVEGYVTSGVAAGATREQVIEGFASAHPMKRLGRPHEPADAILFLASNESSFIAGIDLPVDGGFLA
jgi:3(or 17)beta-hydroxysteroid dehydrogenase